MDKIFTKNIEHESAVKHVTGKAIYTDDISEPKNLLHAVIGYSNCSKGVIKKIDYKDVLSSEGVVDIITCLLYTSPSPRDTAISRMPSSA